jgi:hypothetical protein
MADETETPKPARRAAMRAERAPEPDQGAALAALTAERDALAEQLADARRAIAALSRR